ncbi:2-oxo-4-hydroxy-4-carboxy-5-ureidoimidazoline decarboxylase [Rhodococcus wratislaviensis]|uniref:2-oxo-4-hydroxy-4-carboxy-5-ureidoimidazoline decarboxylase n=1 Tax=Rhodococcus wratislaviensis TaxID=44752 RepID=UPI00365E51CE
MPDTAVVTLNALDESALENELLICTPSRTWATAVLSARPYADREDLLAAAADAWRSLTPADVATALANYLPLSDPPDSAHAVAEHGALVASSAGRLTVLRERESRYRARFGFPVVIAAKGLTLEHILAEIDRRLTNDRADELVLAARHMVAIGEGRIATLIARCEGPG